MHTHNTLAYKLFALCLLLVMLGTACTHSNDTPLATDREISLSQESLDITDDGAIVSLRYNITSPASGITPLALCDAAWVTDVEYPFDNIISFRVKPNPEATARETTMEVRYPGAKQPAKVVIRQAAATGDKLQFTTTALDYSSCSIEITPVNDKLQYIVMMAERDYLIANNIDSAEELVAHDNTLLYAYVGELGDMAEFLTSNGIARQGSQSRTWDNLSPATNYVIYGYGIEASRASFERVTPVSYIEIGERMPQRHDIGFDIDVAVSGPEVSVSVTPDGWDGYYVVQFVKDSEEGFIADGEPLDKSFADAVATSFFYLADNLYYYYEYSAEQIMEELGERGNTVINKTLHASHSYMIIVYAIASESGSVPMMVSEPVVEYLTTGSVELSNLGFDVSVSNIMPRSADIEIIPSNDTESYTAIILPADYLPDGDNDTQRDYIVSNYAPFELQGRYFEVVTGLTPDTEYVICLYGIYAESPTTELFTHTFRTNAEGEGTNRIVDVSFTAYDLREVIAIEDYYATLMGYGDYFLSMEVSTARPTHRVHFSLYNAAQVEEYGLDAVRADLLDYSYTSTFDWALCTYGTEYIICGLAEDEHGNVGEMYVSDIITIEPGQTGDAREFVERYADYTD